MAVTTNNYVIINKITKALYDSKVQSGEISAEDISNQVWIFTDDQYLSVADKEKLNGIAAGAQVNVIEGIKVNGENVSPDTKIVNIVVPTKLSDLQNDLDLSAYANIIEGVKVNGTLVTPENKIVNIVVPNCITKVWS
jgi:hypothetical protein